MGKLRYNKTKRLSQNQVSTGLVFFWGIPDFMLIQLFTHSVYIC